MERYSANELYWIGYLYRYWAYTRECGSKSVYKIIKPGDLKKLYFPYHSLDPAQAIFPMDTIYFGRIVLLIHEIPIKNICYKRKRELWSKKLNV